MENKASLLNKASPIHLILAAGVFVVIIAGIFFFFRSETPKNTPSSASGATQAEKDLRQAEEKLLQVKMDKYALYNKAAESMDKDICEQIQDNDTLKSDCIDNVYVTQSSKKNDQSFCEKVVNIGRKSHCLAAFSYDKAVTSGKSADCNSITWDDALKAACTKNVVFAQIENPAFSGSTNTCDSLSGADKEYCVNRIKKDSDIDMLRKASETRDVSLCAKIVDANIKTTCSDAIQFTLAMTQKNATICGKISDSTKKSTCISQIERSLDAAKLQDAVSSDDINKCSSLSSAESKTKCSDMILVRTGIQSRDIATCNKVVDADSRKQCQDAVNLVAAQSNK